MKNDDLVGSQPIDHFALTSGMDYTTAPHLLKPTQWRQVMNMRSYGGALQQLPLQYRCGTVPAKLLHIVNVPTGAAEYSYWLGLSATALYQLRKSDTVGDHVVLKSGLTNTGMPWGTYVHNGCLFFVNDANPVQFCDGGQARNMWNGFCMTTRDSKVDRNLYDAGVDQGPFTKDPFWSGVDMETPSGEIAGTFTWTVGTTYRVYLTSTRMFKPAMTVSLMRGAQTLTGQVVVVSQYYIVVLATGVNVTLVDNAKNGAAWIMYVTYSPYIPCGRYTTVFFDHCVVAALPSNRYAIKWSHLYNYMRWDPASDSEADSRQCTDYQRPDDIVQGVTGLQHYRDRLFIFTPSCIYVMTYTGFPRIVKVDPLVQDYGNGLPYTTAALDDQVVWCDVHHRSFYAWKGQGPENIGGPIADWFFGRLASTSEYAQRTIAVVDRANHEVAWWYVASGSTDYSEAVVYNWVDGSWCVRDLEGGEQCMGRLYKRAKTITEWSGTLIDALTGTCDQLEQSADSLGAVYGTNVATMLNEGSGLTVTAGAQGGMVDRKSVV